MAAATQLRHDQHIAVDLEHLHGGDGRRRGIPLPPAPCSCDRPLLVVDDDGAVQCSKCGKQGRS